MFKIMKAEAPDCLMNLIPTSYRNHFSLLCIDLINSIKSVSDNFETLCHNVKKDVHLYGDSRFDRNKKQSYFGGSFNLY